MSDLLARLDTNAVSTRHLDFVFQLQTPQKVNHVDEIPQALELFSRQDPEERRQERSTAPITIIVIIVIVGRFCIVENRR